jgi:hypothetical protein
MSAPGRQPGMSAPDKRPAFEPAEKLLSPPQYDPAMKRPGTTTTGALLVLLRVIVGVLWTVELAMQWTDSSGKADVSVAGVKLSGDAVQAGLVTIAAIMGTVLLVETILAVLIYLGRNLPRVIVMVFAVFSITGAFIGWWFDGLEITLRTSLLSLGLDILVLLALSSRSAAAYARRNERH